MPFKPNENLTGALRGSLRLVEAEDAKREAEADESGENVVREGFDVSNSPLAEVDPNAIDIELDQINENFAAGTPEKVTDETLARVVDLYRAQALRWEQEEQTKKRAPRGSKKISHAESLEL
jgi:hypothetical protein